MAWPELRLTNNNPSLDDRDFSVIKINEPEITIGRSSRNTVTIPDISISPIHCVLSRKSDLSWTIKDVSTEGLSINDSVIPKHIFQPLTDKDVIKLDANGEYKYIFHVKQLNDTVVSKKRKNSCMQHAVTSQQGPDPKKRICLRTLGESDNSDDSDSSTTMIDTVDETQMDMSDETQIDAVDVQNIIKKKYYQPVGSLKINNHDTFQNTLKITESTTSKRLDTCNEVIALKQKISTHIQQKKMLEEENQNLSKMLKDQSDEFEKNLQEISSFKERKLEHLEKNLLDGKKNMEKEIQMLQDKRVRDIENITNAKDMELKDLKTLMLLNKEEMQKETDILNGRIRKIEAEALNEKKELLETSKFKEEKLRKAFDKEITHYTSQLEKLQNEKKNLEDTFERERTDFLNLIKEKESEKDKLVQALLSQAKKTEQTLKKLKSKIQSDVKPSKNKSKTTATSSKAESPPEMNTDRNSLQSYHNSIECDLQCSICTEVFIKPVTSNCGHTFCYYCLTIWRRNKNVCPTCRTKIKCVIPSITLQSLLETVLSRLDEFSISKRSEMFKERQQLMPEKMLSSETNKYLAHQILCNQQTSSRNNRPRPRSRRYTSDDNMALSGQLLRILVPEGHRNYFSYGFSQNFYLDSSESD